MNLLFHPSVLEHHVADECPEKANRLDLVLANAASVIKAPPLEVIGDLPLEYYLDFFHTSEYQQSIRNKSSILPAGTISSTPWSEEGISFSAGTYVAACSAVLTTVSAATLALQGKQSFALVRPPGHHAHKDRESGFCFFNNVAIAAEYLRRQGQKVMIIDIDLHVGDGTLEYVEDKTDISYFSVNQANTWPYFKPPERENSRNIFLPQGTGDELYIRTLHEYLEPFIDTFRPSIIAVSAGFDTHESNAVQVSDELEGGFRLTKESYRQFWKILDQARMPYFAVLEGGYTPESVLDGVMSFLEKS